MVKIFRQNTIGQIIAIVLAVTALWARAFVVPVEMPESHLFSPIYDVVFRLLWRLPRLATAIALLLVIGEGFWLNIILVGNKMTKAHSLLPMMVYVVTMSWHATMLTVTPMLLASIPLLAATSQLLSDGTTRLPAERNFNASFCIGLMVLCYLPAVAYILPFLFVFVVYKMYRWRDFVISLLGLVAPLIVLVTYAFLTDKLDFYLILIRHDLLAFDFGLGSVTARHWVPLCVFAVILIASLFKLLGSLNDRTVNQRINMGILTLPLLAGVVMSFYTQIKPVDLQSLAMPFAFIGTRYIMAERKRMWVSELIFWLFIISVFFLNFE